MDSNRKITAKILYKILIAKESSKAVLSDFLYIPSIPSSADRKFILDLVKGVTERLPSLDFCIQKVSTVKLSKMETKVLLALRIGTYEILYTNHAPYAIVSECVSMIKETKNEKASRFVNGVLRHIEREKDSLLLSFPKAVSLSLPDFLYDSFLEWYGEEKTEKIGAYFLSPDSRKVSVRFLESRSSKDSFDESLKKDKVSYEISELSPNGYFLSVPSELSEIRAFSEHLLYIQDSASIYYIDTLFQMASLREGARILDSCASPGGKSIGLMDLCKKNDLQIHLTAADVSDKKVRFLSENFETLQMPIEVITKDATEYDSGFSERFDLLMADVPCSALGIIAGHPDIKYNVSSDSLTHIVSLQKEILSVQCRYVKKGGILAYSTCTINPWENTYQIASFLQENPNFRLLKEEQILPGDKSSDGFYFAILKKGTND